MATRSAFATLALAVMAAFTATRVPAPPARAADDAGRPAAQADSAATAGAADGQKPAAAPDTPEATRPKRGCDLLAEYLGLARSGELARAGATGPAAGPAASASQQACAPVDRVLAARDSALLDPPLVVVLPDPIDSRLDWAFDGGLEAVRRAYERSGYVLDRFWLPWAVDADTSRAKKDARRDGDAAMHRRLPGVLLFKRAPDTSNPGGQLPEVRLAYLVSELATGGVNQAVFDGALADRLAVRRAARTRRERAAEPREPPRRDTIRVVGPIFSGSVASINRRLRAWARRSATPVKAVVISGGATAASNKQTVDADGVGRPREPRLLWPTARCDLPDPDPAIDFWATVNPVDSTLAVTRRLLRAELDIPLAQVAVLREASTAFGAAAESKAPAAGAPLVGAPLVGAPLVGAPLAGAPLAGARAGGGRVRRAPRAAGAPAARDAARGAAADTASCVPLPATPPAASADWLEIPVPMNISRLRGDLLRTLATAPALPGAPAPGRTPLDLQDPATARENLPVLSRLSAPAAERTLEDIAQTLLAHRVRAVVIVATDVRDRIVLAHEVRTRLRDVKVVIVGSHSLYLRPEINPAMRGTLVVSTYPLFLESQFWDAAPRLGRNRFAFTSDMAEGTFNATLLQLGAGDRVIDYTYPLATLALPLTHRTPPAARTPPVWTTVVGRAAMLPVRADSLAWAVADSAATFWYVHPRPDGALVPPGTLPHATAQVLPRVPPGEATHAGLSTVDDRVLVVVLGFVAVCAFAGFRFADGVAPFGTRALVPPPALGWPWRGSPSAADAEQLARAERAKRAADFCRTNRWCVPLLGLELHATAWTLLRHAALLGTLVPAALVLFRGRIHGAVFDALTPPVLILAAVAVAAGLFVEDVVRLRRLGVTYGSTAARLAARPAAVVAIALLYAGFSVRLAVEVTRGAGAGAETARRAAAAVFTARALQLGSGVSPLVPLFVGGLLVLASAAWHLRRVAQLREVTAFEAACAEGGIAAPGKELAGDGGATAASWRARVAPFFVTPREPRDAPPVGSPEAFAASTRALRAQLVALTPSATGAVLVALLLALVAWIAVHVERSAETLALGPITPAAGGAGPVWWALPGTFDLLFRFLLAAALTLTAWTLFRFVGSWNALRRCLQELAVTPLVPAFRRLPKLLPELSQLTPFSTPEKRAADAAFEAVANERWAALARAHPAADAALREAVAAAAARHLPAGEPLAGPGRPPLPFGCQDPTRVAAIGAAYGALYRRATAAAPGAAPPQPGSALAVAQEIAALYAVDYVEWVVRHLRRLAFALLATLVLATVLLSSYPFEPQSLVKATFFVLMAASVAALLAALVQMNRDPVLSAVTHTAAGEVTWDARFVLNLVLVGAVPALTLLGTQFSEARDFLFSWVTPILRTVGRN